jgi:hypothetical protein
MDRPSLRHGIALVLALAVALLPAVGCQSVLVTAMYLIHGTDVDPDFKDLKGKKVAVVCRPMVTLQYRDSSAGRDLAQQVTLLLQNELKDKIQMIDQRKVAKWTDENTWEEYSEVGKALKAEMVVGIDLESFSIFQGQTLYQGKANATIKVFDCRKGSKLVFEKTIPQSIYPPNAGIATSERTEAEFRREFLLVLANQIARHFYSHDPYADLGQDAAALR